MKTSNKLLIGALALVLTGMIVANIYLKTKIDKIKNDVQIEDLQEIDSENIDSVSNTIRIQIN